MTDLTTRIEQAVEGEQRELLFAAAKEIWTWAYAPATVDPDLWAARWVKFNRLLNAEAYLDAAIMLVPEDMGWEVDSFDYTESTAVIYGGGAGPREARAGTPALAILAAIKKFPKGGAK